MSSANVARRVESWVGMSAVYIEYRSGAYLRFKYKFHCMLFIRKLYISLKLVMCNLKNHSEH